MWQWRSFAFWTGVILLIILATVLYQPAAAKTGSLLVWMNNRIYIMDIDTLTLERIGVATPDEQVSPSPGCFGTVDGPCWVVANERVYRIDFGVGVSSVTESRLPVDESVLWYYDTPVSWSPDGQHFAYTVTDKATKQPQLRVLNISTGSEKINAPNVDPSIAVAWSDACVDGLNASGCELGYKMLPSAEEGKTLPSLIGFAPATGEVRRWNVSPEEIFKLRWGPDGVLQYSRPKRNFFSAEDHMPVFQIPDGSQLANTSPNSSFTVYYQPFTLSDCQAEECMHLGVWLSQPVDQADQTKPGLIYNVDLAKQVGGLNFVPIWSPNGDTFVFVQDGKLIHYDIQEQEATIWYERLMGKFRSLPVFSPNGEGIAFVDNQGQGFSDYRLVVVNPGFKPVEHIVETEEGFKILAWLPN